MDNSRFVCLYKQVKLWQNELPSQILPSLAGHKCQNVKMCLCILQISWCQNSVYRLVFVDVQLRFCIGMITIILDSFMYRFDMSMFGQTILSSKSLFTLIISILDSVLYRENMCIQMRILWKAFSHWWQSFIATKRNSQFFHPLLWKVRFT